VIGITGFGCISDQCGEAVMKNLGRLIAAGAIGAILEFVLIVATAIMKHRTYGKFAILFGTVWAPWVATESNEVGFSLYIVYPIAICIGRMFNRGLLVFCVIAVFHYTCAFRAMHQLWTKGVNGGPVDIAGSFNFDAGVIWTIWFGAQVWAFFYSLGPRPEPEPVVYRVRPDGDTSPTVTIAAPPPARSARPREHVIWPDDVDPIRRPNWCHPTDRPAAKG